MRSIACALLVLFSLQSFAAEYANPRVIRLSNPIHDYSYDFGNIRIAWPAYTEIEVVNDTNSIAYIETFDIQGPIFSGYTLCPWELYPQDVCKISLKYEAFDKGTYSDMFRLKLDDRELRIHLNGSTLRVKDWPSDPTDPNDPIPMPQ